MNENLIQYFTTSYSILYEVIVSPVNNNNIPWKKLLEKVEKELIHGSKSVEKLRNLKQNENINKQKNFIENLTKKIELKSEKAIGIFILKHLELIDSYILSETPFGFRFDENEQNYYIEKVLFL
jgi:hypothetical protein